MEICCQPERILRPPDYRERYESYEPPAELVQTLKDIDRPMTVLAVFGMWCQDSRVVVPALLKALAEADNGNLQLLAVHVTYAETDPSPFMAGPVPVRRYPTVAFLDGRYQRAEEIPEGAEKARFVEEMVDAEALAKALG